MSLLKVNQGGEVLNMPPHAVYRLIREGIIPERAVVRIGKNVRLIESRLREWVEAGGTALADRGAER